MSLINQQYFKGRFNLPVNLYSDLQAGIDLYEFEFLELIFGYALAKEISEYSDSSTQRIKDLVEGKEWTNISGYTEKWKGLKNENYPFIVCYCFSQILRNQLMSVGNVAVTLQNTENGQNIGTSLSVQAAWSQIYAVKCELDRFIHNSFDVYPEYCFKNIGSENYFGL